MIALAIVSILIGTAVPSLVSYLPQWRLEGATNSIGHMFAQARFEAIKKNSPVLVAIANEGSAASSISLYRDNNRNNSPNDAGDELITRMMVGQQNKGIYIFRSEDCGTNTAPLISFGIDGTIRWITGGAKGAMPLIVTVDSETATSPDQYFIIVERSGVSRVERAAPSGCP